ncbi:helix-turn-helix transcriptional regulator [Vibrio sp. S9_S30]|uniref:helix-turn-helix domain-containing protein n=1 Tax=Vibrio sp. S9_S30 TaxID=2720226 RepID=UPI0016804F39|nr:helix-turn-helix transcriptional regulator [Vibrio sp. S9_S30]MBD1559520.1 helix-turn-helix transcriptional regulator [Vibrio sp. S9_S30]
MTLKVDPVIYVLRRYREHYPMTQREFSNRSKISLATVQRMESGRSDMKVSQYRTYCNVLGLSDLDVTLSLFTHEYVTEKDLAAMCKLFPQPVRQVIVRFLVDLSQQYSTD